MTPATMRQPNVASHVEAWIETNTTPWGLPLMCVASHVEAWIETMSNGSRKDRSMGRLPCGGVD